MNYGSRIAHLRKNRSLTQEEVAQRIGVSRAAYSHYEHNRRKPNYTTLRRISSLFQVSIDYLLGRTDDPSIPQPMAAQGSLLRPTDNSDGAVMENPQALTHDTLETAKTYAQNFAAAPSSSAFEEDMEQLEAAAGSALPMKQRSQAHALQQSMESGKSRNLRHNGAISKAYKQQSASRRMQEHTQNGRMQQFMSNLELSDAQLFQQFQLTIDGEAVTEEEARRFIAFIRAERQG